MREPHSKRVEKMRELHSKRVEKMPGIGELLTTTEMLFVLIQKPLVYIFKTLKTTLETSGKDRKYTLQTSGKDRKTTLQTSVFFVPLVPHLLHSFVWVLMSFLTNLVFRFSIGIPIHTLFRSCNIVSSLGEIYTRNECSFTSSPLVSSVI
jgi:hypothetical protein